MLSAMASRPEGFAWSERHSGDIVITHHGKNATVLRGARATQFLDDVDGADDRSEQELMARLTGNYKRGNERTAKNHPRNRR